MRFSSPLLAGLLPLLAFTAVPNALVVPGRSLGNITLGANASTLAALGPATFSDAAMQKAWSTWRGSRPPTAALPPSSTCTPPQLATMWTTTRCS